MVHSVSGDGLYLVLLSVHGLVRGTDLELGRDADTGGQVKYVVELAQTLSSHPEVARVDLMTRQIFGKEKRYEEPLEQIAEKSYIVRVPCGPKRYLKKEKLWPYLDSFTDQALHHIRNVGRVPNVIHGHYADAGYVGGQIARLLGVTFIFTGHSLGRVKQKSLLDKGKSKESIEKKFNFKRRIEAEEFALDTASTVVVSTHQEIEQQYKLYDHYVPARMKVIPPGVDLRRFSPPDATKPLPTYASTIARFLRCLEKPIILAIARPDEKKNFATLVKAYAEHGELRKIANLVLIAGNRDNLGSLGSGARRVLRTLMLMIDRYDLYGSIAYPKHHVPDDIPDLYRIAAKTKGIFVNPAYNEPFGLTLIEAAASGLPMVATNDGGPKDILNACQNGVLIDPRESKKLGEEMYRAISDSEQWDIWSKNGLKGALQTFSWDSHIDSYVTQIKKLIRKDGGEESSQLEPVGLNRFTVIDRILAINIDEVLVGNIKGMKRLYERLGTFGGNIALCLVTRYSTKHAIEVIRKYEIPMPDVLVTSAGSEINYGKWLVPDALWEKHINYKWRPEAVYDAIKELEGLELELESENSFFKISYLRTSDKAPRKRSVAKHLRQKGIRANVLYSQGSCLDIMPIRNSLGLALRYLIFKWGVPPERFLIAGSSGLEEEIFSGNTLGVVVRPFSPEIKHLKSHPHIFFSTSEYSDGLLEGIDHYHFFEDIIVPGIVED
jgi:sucrose-phosphate synthase